MNVPMLFLWTAYVDYFYNGGIPQTKHADVYGMENLVTANHPETMVHD